MAIVASAFVSYGQVKLLDITNNASYPVYFNIVYSVNSGSPLCTVQNVSQIIMIPPSGGHLHYSGDAPTGNPAYIPGAPPPFHRYILAVNVMSANPATCPGVISTTVGEATCGYPGLITSPVYDPSCSNPQNRHITWITVSPTVANAIY